MPNPGNLPIEASNKPKQWVENPIKKPTPAEEVKIATMVAEVMQRIHPVQEITTHGVDAPSIVGSIESKRQDLVSLITKAWVEQEMQAAADKEKQMRAAEREKQFQDFVLNKYEE